MNTSRKAQLKAAYKLAPTFYGVIQIKNQVNHKIFIEAVANLHNRWAYYQLNLNQNFYHQTPLQHDWLQMGPEAFAYTVLWQADTSDVINMRQTLKALKLKWLRQLQPFDDQGYNHRPLDWKENHDN